jgi:hypothetical protein
MAAAQCPPAGQINLDHVAHFIPGIDSASAELERLGFTLTPFSAQSHRLETDGPLLPAGTGNRCVMLREGYLEFLTPMSNTPIANQLRDAFRRYVGVHLIAFGTAAPEADRARISKAGFEPLAPIALERRIETTDGEDVARFTVLRVPAGTMAEGRIQFCQHHTPGLLWQSRWINHANRAAGLAGVVLCVEDPEHTAHRYAAFTGLPPQMAENAWRIDTSRGYLLFVAPDVLRRQLDIQPPDPPWIAGYVLKSDDVDATGGYLRDSDFRVQAMENRRLWVRLPSALGGIVIFEPPVCHPLIFE